MVNRHPRWVRSSACSSSQRILNPECVCVRQHDAMLLALPSTQSHQRQSVARTMSSQKPLTRELFASRKMQTVVCSTAWQMLHGVWLHPRREGSAHEGSEATQSTPDSSWRVSQRQGVGGARAHVDNCFGRPIVFRCLQRSVSLGLVPWTLLVFVVTLCTQPPGAMCGSAPASPQADNRHHLQGGLSGTRGLLREGIASPVTPYPEAKQHAISQAAHDLRIPPVQPSICKVPAEFMPPLSDELADDDASSLPRSVPPLVPDLGFETQQKQHRHEDRERSPWCGSESGYNNESPRIGGIGGITGTGGLAWAMGNRGAAVVIGGIGGAEGLRGGVVAAASTPPNESGSGWNWSGGGIGGSPVRKGTPGGGGPGYLVMTPYVRVGVPGCTLTLLRSQRCMCM